MTAIFIFVTDLLKLCQSTLLMLKLLSDYLGNKIKRILEEQKKPKSVFTEFI